MKKTKRKKRTEYGLEGVRKKVAPIADLILSGDVLAIDPSIISSSSNPGWALYKEGELHSSGTITGIDPRRSVEDRLQFLGKYCREEFDEPDVLVIEHINPGRGPQGRAMIPTIRSTGAIIGSFECEHVISIVPLSWQSMVLKYINLEGHTEYEKYKHYKETIKSDEEDAKWIGRTIIELAKEVLDTSN